MTQSQSEHGARVRSFARRPAALLVAFAPMVVELPVPNSVVVGTLALLGVLTLWGLGEPAQGSRREDSPDGAPPQAPSPPRA